ncbi:hypothetical protein PU630_02770 [Microbacterium horticulturae]|uniref:MoaD/ThiS family protein n=1 Tax=Microbacterium horticulturae TaxID=3028316 RepID=A0ABY8C057_9MICO|nr:hypothetical protein [Microbacterium sp. KACC 23027]WEG09507.1 hypothetical protein PU630_02770 [Microbacterium sp. KACC 23027]
MVERIDIEYGGRTFSVGGQELSEVVDAIDAALAGGDHWLRVNDGDGAPREAFLLVTPGTPLAVVPIPGTQPPDVSP